MALAARSGWRRPRLGRLALAACGALPRPVHRVLAAPGRERGGRRLEPDLELLLALLERFDWPDFANLSPADARREIEREARIFALRRARGVAVSELAVPAPAGPLAARLYVPVGAEQGRTLLLYLHGGGWVFGSPVTSDGVCGFIARHARVRVLSTSYRLAPEHRFPAAVDDAGAALEWTLRNSVALGAGRVGVGGDSAGANLATVLVGEAGGRLAFQLLLYPVTDLSREHPSYATFEEGPLLTATQMRWFRSHYLRSEEDSRDPRASPLLARDLTDMPPTYLALAGFDPLCDEGLAYGARLRAAGAEITMALHSGQVHAFADITRASPSARAALMEACHWLTRR
jgi:acetyl esterase